MRKTSFSLTKVKVHDDTRYCVTTPVAHGPGRQRRFFADKAEAKTFLDLKRAEIQRHGLSALSLGDQDRANFLWCAEQLRPYDLTVRQAVELLLPQLQAREHGLSIEDAVKRLLESKRKARLSERHLYSLENRLSRFATHHAGRLLASFTFSDIEQWLNALPVGPQSMNHYKASLHSLFRYGVKIGATLANPVSGIDSREVVRPPPPILTPEQLSTLLLACSNDGEMLAYFAVAAFAGLRRAEIEGRLRWEHINLRRGFITVVPAADTKVKNRRLVPICTALRDWLTPVAKSSGPLAPTTNFRKRFDTIRKAAGLLKKWDGNELRHSYATYRLAETQNAAQVALEIGNSPSTLQEHYNKWAEPEDAAKWFSVKPTAARNVVSFAA
jgi:integrase